MFRTAIQSLLLCLFLTVLPWWLFFYFLNSNQIGIIGLMMFNKLFSGEMWHHNECDPECSGFLCLYFISAFQQQFGSIIWLSCRHGWQKWCICYFHHMCIGSLILSKAARAHPVFGSCAQLHGQIRHAALELVYLHFRFALHLSQIAPSSLPIFLSNLDKFWFSLPRFLGKLNYWNKEIIAKQG